MANVETSAETFAIPTLTSLGAKLFYLTVALVLLTVAGITWQNSFMFRSILAHQVEDGLILESAQSATSAGSILDNWSSQLAIMVHALTTTASPEDRTRLLHSFLAASQEFVGLEILKVGDDGKPVAVDVAMATELDARLLGSLAPKTLAKAMRATGVASVQQVLDQKVAAPAAAAATLLNVSSALGVPTVALLWPFTTQADHGHYWAFLTMWPTRLAEALPHADNEASVLVDRNGAVVASPNPDETFKAGGWAEVPLTKTALASTAQAGFKGFHDTHGVDWLGAFTHLRSRDLTILVRRDAAARELATATVIKRTLIWAWAFVLMASLVSFFGASGITRSLRSLTAATSEIARGNFAPMLKASARDEVGALSHSVTHMAGEIQRLLRDTAAKAQLEKELETARLVQTAFFPKAGAKEAVGRPLHVSGFFQPASQCGGDWWGDYPAGDGQSMICIGDATGHGAGAALVTAIIYSSCMTSAKVNASSGTFDSPSQLLTRVNQVLWDSLGGTIAMTFFAALFDAKRGTITFANAGHNFPLLVSKDPKTDTRLKKFTNPLSLSQPGQPLGMTPGMTYDEQTWTLRPGDKIVFYTDGLIECKNTAEVEWGKRRLTELLRKSPEKSGSELCKTLQTEAFAHFGEHPLADDVTVVVAEVAAGWGV